MPNHLRVATNPRLFNTRRLANWLSLTVVVALTALAIAWLADWIQRGAVYPFDSDEGLHAYNALRVSAYLRDGDLLGAWEDSLLQSFYPPVHSWLLGVALSLASATHVNARLFSLALYALDVLLLYALGRWLARGTRFPWLGGLIASLLALAAPPMWVNGSLVYIEMAGVTCVLAAFWGYWQGIAATPAGKNKRRGAWLTAGISIAAAALTKFPYWLFLSIPLVAAVVWQTWRIERRSWRGWGTLVERLAWLVLPSIVLMLAWVAWPSTRTGLADYIAATENLAQAAQPSPLTNFVYYLQSVWLQFSPSLSAGAGLSAVLAASLMCWRDDQLRPLWIFFLFHVAGLCVHGDLSPRYLITAMPALWLMGGVWAARWAEAWPGWIGKIRMSRLRVAAQVATWAAIMALALTSALGLAWRVTLYPTLYMLSLETDSRADDLYRWAAEQIPAGPARIGLVNDWDQMSGPALGWELTTRRAPNGAPRRADLVSVWEMHRLPEPTPENIDALRDQMNARGLNTLVAYTAPGSGIKRLQGTIALLGDKTRLLGKRDFSLRWYWPNKMDQRLYDGESLDEEQLRAAIDQLGTDRSLTVHVYAYTP